jgi:hypothetical protein
VEDLEEKGMRLRVSDIALVSLAGALVATGGCSNGASIGPCVPVEGKVTLGAKPLVGGTVTFVPAEGQSNGPRPEGQIDAQGLYALKTGEKQGAPPGRYRAVVTISGLDKAQNAEFNPLYSHWDKSPLVIPVTENAAAGAYDLKLKPR